MPHLKEFKSFMAKYGRTYGSRAEFQQRYGVFEANLKLAAQRTAASKGKAVHGVTQFMDMTPAEFKQAYLMSNAPARNETLLRQHYVEHDFTSFQAPNSFNWVGQSPNIVTPVYNQGQCGSCWAFSATEAVESQWAKSGHGLTELSMQQVVDCDTTSDGCNGGWTYLAYEYLISAPGQESLNAYPYTAQTGYCQFNSADVVATISSWNYVTQTSNEQEMVNTLASTGPLSICVYAEPWQTYVSGVMMGSDCQGQTDHCVMATGYNLGGSTPYWIVRNSWGTSWGLDGFIWVQYGVDACNIADTVTLPVV